MKIAAEPRSDRMPGAILGDPRAIAGHSGDVNAMYAVPTRECARDALLRSVWHRARRELSRLPREQSAIEQILVLASFLLGEASSTPSLSARIQLSASSAWR